MMHLSWILIDHQTWANKGKKENTKILCGRYIARCVESAKLDQKRERHQKVNLQKQVLFKLKKHSIYKKKEF